MESVGGYFASLKLLTDEGSFKKGATSLKGVAKDLGAVVKWTAGLSVLKDVMGGWLSAMQRDELILAKTMNMNSLEVSAWSTAVGAAGVSTGQFTGALAGLETRIQRMKLGEVDVGLARALGMLGVGFTGFAKSDASDRTRLVLQQALAMKDQGKAAQLVSDVLGDAGKEYFWYLKMTGVSLNAQLAEARALTFTNRQSKMDAMIFGAEIRKTGGAIKEIGGLFGSTFAKSLTPLVRNINAMIVANKGLIATKVTDFARLLGKEVQVVYGFFEKWLPRVESLVGKLGGLEGIVKKLAIGFAAWKIAQLSVGIFNIVKGIGGLAGAVKSLAGVGLSPVLIAFVALYLIIQDLTSSDSVLKELGKMFVDLLPPGVQKDFANFWKDIKEALPSIASAGKEVMGFFGALTGGVVIGGIKNLASFLTWIDVVLRDLKSGNYQDIVKNMPIAKLIGDVAKGDFSKIGKDIMGLTIMKANPLVQGIAAVVGKITGATGKGSIKIEMHMVDKTERGVTVTTTGGELSAAQRRAQQAGTGVLP